MDKEKIIKVISQIKSKKSKNIKNNVDLKKEKAIKIANILMRIEKCVNKLQE